MAKITGIEPTSTDFMYSKRKLRTAAYCRVSTDSDEQQSSLENQRTHYANYIKANLDWDFMGMYFDEGISATKKEKRFGLLKLLKDCESRKIDFIVTKSISRFARNTTDCLEIVRRLTDLGISIWFEKENINTGTMDSELILSILSSLASEESVSISQNNKWGIKRRFQNGTFKLCVPPYGYDYNGKSIVPNPKQAQIVKRIFSEILSGSGTHAVAKKLNADAIPAPRGKNWTATTIQGMVENERYIGDVLFQKTYTDERFKRRTNVGMEEQYYWENHHEAIISKEDFEAAALILEQRGKEKGITKGSGKYTNRYSFSGIIICGECGSTFKRQIHMSGRPSEYVAWCCSKHINSSSKGCSMIFVRDEHIKTAFVTMMNRLFSGRNVILKPLIDELKEQDVNGIYAKLKELETLIQKNSEQVQILTGLMSAGILTPALFNEKNNVLKQEATKLKEQKSVLQADALGEESDSFETEELLKHLNKTGISESFSDEIFTRFTNNITIILPTEVGFNLKCGLFLKERMAR